ncbi:cyclase family protein (plasmid) [Deinococcus taeanensis]|uniref:cyclase family protein n=1 Tax=Deinococcus taeanensis TaxID=2737050 RepID=UPI001CDCC7B2|nr:cyclase family protein [Deinococcus taeanensis]UBV44866.1 cyclase family protein [Deinococcus taeanensis]
MTESRRPRLIDLSVTLSNDTAAFEPNPHQITYTDHAQAAQAIPALMGLSAAQAARLMPRGHLWSVETVTLSTHSGTHVDAPYHYGPRMADGGAPLTIDQVPLDWCYGPGVCLDFTHKSPGDGITDTDVDRELRRIGHDLQPGDIVLTHTGASRHFHEPGYEHRHAGYTRAGLACLVERGVRLIGTDAWGIDRPFPALLKDAAAGTAEFWEAHLYGLERPYLQIEKLSNLDQLPGPTGFTVSAFPVKVQGASAAWARVVALIP